MWHPLTFWRKANILSSPSSFWLMPHFLKMPSFSLQTGLGFAEGTPNRRPMHSTTSSFGARKGEAPVPGLGQRPTDELDMQISWHFPRKTTAKRLRTMAEQNQMLRIQIVIWVISVWKLLKAGLSSLHAFRLMSSVKINHPFGPGLTNRAPTVNLEATMWVERKVSTFHRVKCRFVGAGSIDSNILGVLISSEVLQLRENRPWRSTVIFLRRLDVTTGSILWILDRFQEVLDSNFDWPQLKHLGSLQEFPFLHKCYPSSWNLHEISLRSKGIRKMAQQCLASFIHII